MVDLDTPRPAATAGVATRRRLPAPRRILAVATAVAMLALLWAAFWLTPTDTVQGPAQRIFYIHVPSAWVGFLALAVLCGASIGYLVTRRRGYDDVAAASAGVGAVFLTVVLVTGPLWARPTWGVYWVWDPRLTSFFVLWLIVVSYLALRGFVADPDARARFAAVAGIVGFLDVPVVYLSVSWWRGMHPVAVVATADGPRMPAVMLVGLLIGVVACTLLYLYLMALRLSVARGLAAAEARELEGSLR